jgi:hypothetical protein
MSDQAKESNFDQLTDSPNFFMNVREANQRLATQRDNPYSMREGTFKVPDGINRDLFDKLVKKAGDKWVTSMDKKGWTLRTRVKLFGPFSSADLLTGVPLLGEKEFRLSPETDTV